MLSRLQRHARVGVPKWTADEQQFARECQQNFAVEAQGMASEVLPLGEEIAIGGSSDVADVSWNTLTMGCTMPAWPQGVSAHPWPVVACGGMSIGVKGTLQAAKVLGRQGRLYISPLPPERKHPTGVPQ